jgi:hypothetical protein
MAARDERRARQESRRRELEHSYRQPQGSGQTTRRALSALTGLCLSVPGPSTPFRIRPMSGQIIPE